MVLLEPSSRLLVCGGDLWFVLLCISCRVCLLLENNTPDTNIRPTIQYVNVCMHCSPEKARCSNDLCLNYEFVDNKSYPFENVGSIFAQFDDLVMLTATVCAGNMFP